MAGDGLFFGFGPRKGFSIGFEVRKFCKNKGSPIDCQVEFNGSREATKIGPHVRGEFPANPDVAGIGVLVSTTVVYGVITVFSVIVCVAGIARFISKRRNPLAAQVHYSNGRASRIMRNVAFAVTDSSLVLGWGYLVSFLMSSKCSLSHYHYYIVLDVILVFLSSVIVSTALVDHHYWESSLRFLRLGGSIGLLVVLALLLIYQTKLKLSPEWFVPRGGRTDSSMLLPAACFLDPDLLKWENPMSQDLTALEDPYGRSKLGKTTVIAPELVLVCVLGILFILIHSLTYSHFKDRNKGGHSSGLLLALRILILVENMLVGGMCFYHIFRLRSWIYSSGWMDALSVAAEGNFYDLGQLLPILSMATLASAAWEEWWAPVDPPQTQKENGHHVVDTNASAPAQVWQGYP